MSEFDKSAIRRAVRDSIQVQFNNPSWDRVSDILGDLFEDYEPGVNHGDEEDFAYGLFGTATFKLEGEDE